MFLRIKTFYQTVFDTYVTSSQGDILLLRARDKARKSPLRAKPQIRICIHQGCRNSDLILEMRDDSYNRMDAASYVNAWTVCLGRLSTPVRQRGFHQLHPGYKQS